MHRGGVTVALDHVDLTIERGECVALLGPVGSGKTALLELLGARHPPSEGSVRLEGRALEELAEPEQSALRLREIGYLAQHAEWRPGQTVFAAVAADLDELGIARADTLEAADAHLELVGLSHRGHEPVARLGPAERQRLAIARALARSPHTVLADEPTARLDAAGAERAITLLLRLHAELALTLIYATRDEALARRADRLIRLSGGRLVADGPARPAWEGASEDETAHEWRTGNPA
jgi:putative ABC transport system ATP-binding protein